ncbi:hypothetical protein GVN16_21975 [Emticicia sp. CRIBPO]|uniref:hypothetical protein n=1 Tax=Emticicia sp. CRIBPO TaxID=2683258 RepID=UPI0014134737|nr:hypothetical protein [Emticicia sp. CRIBPO]NBA88457.1 hypothetical protein [Emticicia sp. CRIBPO]
MKIHFLLLLILLTSCKKAEVEPQHVDFTGIWEMAGKKSSSKGLPNGGMVLRRATTLPDENYGFSFKENGQLTARLESMVCLFPHITFATYEGEWRQENNRMLIKRVVLGEEIISNYKITVVTANEVIFSYEKDL